MADAKAKIPQLISEVRERLDEIETLMGEGDIPDVRKSAKRGLQTFAKLWSNRHGEAYDTKWVADRPHLNRWLRQGHPIERIEAKMAAFILDNDPALVRARHPFTWFVSRFNTIRVDVDRADTPAPPVDCWQHHPKCKTDIEHTRKTMQESRS